MSTLTLTLPFLCNDTSDTGTGSASYLGRESECLYLSSDIISGDTGTGNASYLGRVPANVKFEVQETLNDGSYLSLIGPIGQVET